MCEFIWTWISYSINSSLHMKESHQHQYYWSFQYISCVLRLLKEGYIIIIIIIFLIYYNILNVSIILWSSMSGIPNKGSWYWHFMLPFNYCMKCLEQRHGLQLSIKAVPIPILAASSSLAITASKAFANFFMPVTVPNASCMLLTLV